MNEIIKNLYLGYAKDDYTNCCFIENLLSYCELPYVILYL